MYMFLLLIYEFMWVFIVNHVLIMPAINYGEYIVLIMFVEYLLLNTLSLLCLID